MSKYTLKSVVQRGTMFGATFALVAAVFAPLASPTYADALNPLTDRSLTLSSSSPGWDYLDGSGNATYAQPNSGANGKKTGNTFSFKVSTDTTVGADKIKAFTFQYCTQPAGSCMAPGDNGWQDANADPGDFVRNPDSATTSDLNIAVASPSQIEQAELGDYVQLVADTTPGAEIAAGTVLDVPAASATGENFIVMWNDAGTWKSLDGWTMTAHEVQYGDKENGESTGMKNQIELVNASNATGLPSGAEVKIVFFGTETNYITNPGSGSFFVKINTYKDVDVTTPADPILDMDDVIDGGVTVANVMNQSIQIVTKVLETMQFSVGTVDPNTLDSTGGTSSALYAANGKEEHGTCDPVVRGMNANNPAQASNALQLGNELGEFSLSTDETYSTHSYWRLSSNSSAGATVYYSGVTLQNTVGDDIDAIGPDAKAPLAGSEQFGLAIANGELGSTANLDLDGDTISDVFSHAVDYTVERGASSGKNFENGADNSTSGVHASVATDVGANPSYHTPRLWPLIPLADYDNGAGVINANYAAPATPISTSFAFDTTSNLIPVAIATEDSQVVDCVTAKMRYIANIAATTPAGIYTTKINYIAAPQY